MVFWGDTVICKQCGGTHDTSENNSTTCVHCERRNNFVYENERYLTEQQSKKSISEKLDVIIQLLQEKKSNTGKELIDEVENLRTKVRRSFL